MTSKYLTTVVLMVVFAWSALMAALGQAAAIGALVPSLVLLLQQAMQALSGEPRRGESAAPQSGSADSPVARTAGAAVTEPPDHAGAGVAGGQETRR